MEHKNHTTSIHCKISNLGSVEALLLKQAFWNGREFFKAALINAQWIFRFRVLCEQGLSHFSTEIL